MSVKEIIKKIMCLLPLRKIIVFESNPDFSDNTYWFFKYLAEETDFLNEYKCVWFVADWKKRKGNLCGKDIICICDCAEDPISRLRRYYYNSCAKIIIDCNRYVRKQRNEQIRVYLTHGMPIKDASKYLANIGKCDILPVISVFFKSYFSQFVEEQNIYIFGNPRNDILLTNKNNIVSEKRIIWMPTFRQHKAGDSGIINNFPLGIPVLKTISDVKTIEKVLEESNTTLYLRPHPAQDLSVFKVKNEKRIVILDDNYLDREGCQLYEFVATCSALITDYSSIHIDFLSLDKPIGVTIEDIEEYESLWPLVIPDARNDCYGVHLINTDDLACFIVNVATGKDSFKKKREQFVKKYGSQTDKSCDKILKAIKTKLK